MPNSRTITKAEEDIFERMIERLHSKKTTKDIKKLKCAIYARKSTEDISGYSILAQIAFCREMISSSKYLEETAVFSEEDVSGFDFSNRKEFLKVLELVDNREIDVIVVQAWDRFSRNDGQCSFLVDKFNRLGVYVLAGDDTGLELSAENRLHQQVQWLLTEYEARRYAQKTKGDLIYAAQNGSYISGGIVPYGYNKLPKAVDNKIRLGIDAIKSIAVIEIFNSIAQGISLREIAKSLNEKLYRTQLR